MKNNIIFVCLKNDYFSRCQIEVAINLLKKKFTNAFNYEVILKSNDKIRNAKSKTIRFCAIFNINIIKKIYILFNLVYAKHKLRSKSSITISSANSAKFLDILTKNNKPIVFFVHFDEIVKNEILNKCNSYNIHSGFIPEYRGCQPLYWQINNKELIGCLTIHRMVKKIDGGDIIVEVPFKIELNKSPLHHLLIQYKNNMLANTIYVAIRRIVYYCNNFGIKQELISIDGNYYKRP